MSCWASRWASEATAVAALWATHSPRPLTASWASQSRSDQAEPLRPARPRSSQRPRPRPAASLRGQRRRSEPAASLGPTTHTRPRWLVAPPQPSASHRLLGQPPPSTGVAAPSSAASLWPAGPTHTTRSGQLGPQPQPAASRWPAMPPQPLRRRFALSAISTHSPQVARTLRKLHVSRTHSPQVARTLRRRACSPRSRLVPLLADPPLRAFLSRPLLRLWNPP